MMMQQTEIVTQLTKYAHLIIKKQQDS